jgi:hypothetical protein
MGQFVSVPSRGAASASCQFDSQELLPHPGPSSDKSIWGTEFHASLHAAGGSVMPVGSSEPAPELKAFAVLTSSSEGFFSQQLWLLPKKLVKALITVFFLNSIQMSLFFPSNLPYSLIKREVALGCTALDPRLASMMRSDEHGRPSKQTDERPSPESLVRLLPANTIRPMVGLR